MSTQITIHLDQQYKSLLNALKNQIRSAQLKAAMAVNTELIQLYWEIGKSILDKQTQTAWGDKLLETLSKDLQNSFPETRGFSIRNLKYMRQFAKSYQLPSIGQQAVAQLPWGHIILLIQKVKDEVARSWYIAETLENAWSRERLDTCIKQNVYQRQGINQNKTSNYLKRLPPPQSNLAQDILKNPYNLDFLELHGVLWKNLQKWPVSI